MLQPVTILLKQMSEPERTHALKAFSKRKSPCLVNPKKIHIALFYAFDWSENGGIDKWSKVQKKYENADK